MASKLVTSPTATRWGLLITTIALALVLVGTGLAGYLGAREAFRSVARARGLDMVMAVRRAMRQSTADHQVVVDTVLADMESQGMRYVGVIKRRGGLIAAAGTPSEPLQLDALLHRPPRREPDVEVVGRNIRLVVPFGPAARAARRGPPRWRAKAPAGAEDERRHWRSKRRWGKRGPDDVMRGGVLVLEYEPVVARTITSRSLAMLLISLVAATVLLVAAVIFWRLSRRAEVMTNQLARDRQLKALGQMSAVLGHELRNPLAALKGHAQLLVELLTEGHPGRRGAETVVREALRMEKLTEQILEFARTGSVDKETENPADVARSAVEQAGFDDIELTLADDLPDRWALDRIRMERVLINLIKNGLQASPPDGIVEVTAERAEGGLQYQVRDHGEGLPAGEEEWIFEPFHTKRVRGTGLGLAVSKQIVEAHGGWIKAENHPDGGALFTLWLPPDEPRRS